MPHIVMYINKAKAFYAKYERFLSSGAFLAGFIFDNLTLRRIDLLYENVVFAWNLCLAVFAVGLINAYEAGRVKGKIADRIVPFLPIGLQFAFGGLLSAFIVFYGRSGSWLVSWPFLVFLILLFVGNEFSRHRYLRLTFQLSMFFIALFTYTVFLLPVLFHRMGPDMFLSSGALALLITGVIVLVFWKVMPSRLEKNIKTLLLSIGCIYLAFQFSYFFNLIPPLPLSLRHSGVYHSLERTKEPGFLYKLGFEKPSWREVLQSTSNTFHWKPGTPIYVYSAVFAPKEFKLNIVHRWSHFDQEKGEWVEIHRIPFPVVGGRDGGYRGYSVKYGGIVPGKWRVDVMNERGQILGRESFTVVKADSLPDLETVLR